MSQRPLPLLGATLPAALLLCLAVGGDRADAASGGPDPGGYSWFDQAEGCPPDGSEFVLAEVESFGLNEWLIGPLELGFHFPFYDGIFQELWVHSDGLVFFTQDWASYLLSNQPIPWDDGLEGGFIAPFWHWQSPDTPSFWWQRGGEGESFRLVAHGSESPAGPPVRWQLVLKRDGDIKIEWFEVGSGDANVTVGMEAPGQAFGTEVLFNGLSAGGFSLEGPGPKALCLTRPDSLSCVGATPIDCGPHEGSFPVGRPSLVDAWPCGGTRTGAEVVHEIELTEVSSLSVSLAPGGGRDQAVYLLAGCTPHACLDGGGLSASAERLPPGRYRIVVDAATALDEGAFSLDVTCTPLGPTATCNDRVVGDNSAGPTAMDGYACLLGDYSGPEAHLLVDHPGGPLTAALPPGDPRAVLLFDAAEPLSPRECLSGGVGGAAQLDAAPGRYLVVVDSAPADAGPFELELGCGAQVPCAGAEELTCNSLFQGTTASGTLSAEFYGCTAQAYTGPESVHVFDNPIEQVVSFQLDDSAEPRLDLHLLEGCDEGACLGTHDREISRLLPAGRYHLVVDGREGASGPYEILTACGQSLEPVLVTASLAAGECLDENKVGWLTPEIPKADVLFLLDTSGSMGEEIAQLKIHVRTIVDRVEGFVQDGAYGLATVVDYISDEFGSDPCWYSGPNYGRGADYPWRLDQPISDDRTALEAAVDALTTYDGLDDPESYTRGLHEALADPDVAWRPGSRRVVVLFADAMPHDCNVLECMGLVSYFSHGVDFGRDGLGGTADDLELLPTVQALADAGVGLVVLDSGGSFLRVEGSDWPRSHDMWGCLAGLTGGPVVPLAGNGIPEGGRPLSDEVVDLIRTVGTHCDELELVAEPGWEDWLTDAGGVHLDRRLPTRVEYDIRICVPEGTPGGTYSFQVLLQCDGLTVAAQDVIIEVGEPACALAVIDPPSEPVVCVGESATLDCSGLDLSGCEGEVQRAWFELPSGALVGEGPLVEVVPDRTTDYEVLLTCSTDPGCGASELVRVAVEQPPGPFGLDAVDLTDCSKGVELRWSAADFPSASGGRYHVHRSEVSCAEALLAAPIATDLLGRSFVDRGAPSGVPLYYAIVAESSEAAGACTPVGPRGGASSSACLASPIIDLGDEPWPDGVFATLRARHVGQTVTLTWEGARPLLPREHVHLLKASDRADAVFATVTEEAHLARFHEETDESSTLQFFDLRVANACEDLSDDEFPASR